MDQLAALAPEDAFRLAIRRSAYDLPTLCKRLGWSASFMRRVLSTEKYFPSFEDIPAFCRAVGNIIVIQWQMARVAFTIPEAPAITPDLLQRAVLDLSVELGDVADRVRSAIADGVVTKKETRGITKELLELIESAVGLAGNLKDFDKKVALNG